MLYREPKEAEISSISVISN